MKWNEGNGMQIHRRRLKMGITSKVVLSMFLVVLTTMLTIAFYSYTKSKNLAIEQVKLELYAKAETVETTVSALFEQKGEIVRQLSIIPVIESFGLANATRENAQSNKDYEWLQKALINAKNLNENIEMVWLANIEKSYFIADNEYISDASYSIKGRPWYEAAINKKGLSYSLPYFDFATEKLTISIIHPVTINNKTFGFLGVDIHLDDLPGLLAPFESDGRHLILVSNEGYVMYDSQNMWPTLQDADWLLKDVQKIETKDGIYYSAFREVGELGWKVGVYMPESEIMASFHDYEKSLGGSWLITLLILMITLTFVLHYLLKDIPVIVHHINKIEEGFLDVHIGIKRRDEVGEIAFAVEQMAGKIKAQIDKLDYQAKHDSLTKLSNRKSIEDTLQKWIDEIDINNEIIAVMFLDLDHFKLVNDSKGHVFGDALLVEVGKRIEAQLTSNSFIGRFGGDEFIILVRDSKKELDQIHLTIKHIFHSFSTPFPLLKQFIYSTPSIGVSFYPADAQSMDELLVNADTALYHAKENGRNCIFFFTAEMKKSLEKELILKEGLRNALINNEFTLHYQPQLNTKTGKPSSVEALIRWTHPEWGIISPADFIPLAESSGQIGAIGDWVIDTSLQMINRLKSENIHFETVAINVSAIQLREQDFAEKLQERLTFYNVSPTSLEIEITESVLIDYEEETIQKLVALKQLGIQIALDDFGTGYSSLNYLRMMPIDRVKVDQSFIQKIEDDSIVEAILNTIVTLSHSLGFKIVAEGVEEEAQHEILLQMNVDCIQGYLYSRPLDEEAVLGFLRQQA